MNLQVVHVIVNSHRGYPASALAGSSSNTGMFGGSRQDQLRQQLIGPGQIQEQAQEDTDCCTPGCVIL